MYDTEASINSDIQFICIFWTSVIQCRHTASVISLKLTKVDQERSCELVE